MLHDRRSISDIFRIHVIASTTVPTAPLITLGSTTFFHIRYGPLWLVAVTKNVSPFLPHQIPFLTALRSTECQRRSHLRIHVQIHLPR